MEIKNYILEYLVNGIDSLEYIGDLDGCLTDFEASGKNNMKDWLEGLITDIEVIDEISCKNSDVINSYHLIFKINNTYYSIYVEPFGYGLKEIDYDSLHQVVPKQKTITVYEPIDE